MADRPLRVLHVIESLGRGGAEQLLVNLLPALAQHDIAPLVAVLRGPFDLQPELEARGITVIKVPGFSKWNLPAGVRALHKVCADKQIDIIHAHLYFPSLYVGLLGARGPLPTFETFHNMAYAGANGAGIKLRFRRALRALIAKRSNSRFLAVSGAVADHYSAALGLTEVNALPNAIDLTGIDKAIEMVAAQNRTKPHSQTHDPDLKFVVPGRLVAEKGHSDLLRALAGAKLPPYSLHFLGGGPLETQLVGEAEALGVPVTISGALPHDQFLAALAVADICIAPSRFEGFGIAAAEAMALGIPTIASDAGGLPQVIGDAGDIVPAGDSAKLRTALEDLAQDPARRESLGIAGSAHVRDKFSASRSAAHLASLYRAAFTA